MFRSLIALILNTFGWSDGCQEAGAGGPDLGPFIDPDG